MTASEVWKCAFNIGVNLADQHASSLLWRLLFLARSDAPTGRLAGDWIIAPCSSREIVSGIFIDLDIRSTQFFNLLFDRGRYHVLLLAVVWPGLALDRKSVV